jgi:hypothetical protein
LDLTVAGFSAFMTGEPIPAVDPHDLRGVFELSHQLRAQFVQNSGTEVPGPQPSISVALLAEACAPGANVIAVSLRGLLLDAMASQGLLAPWQRGPGLQQAVFDAAATFPIPALDRFHPDDFVRSLAAQRD